MHFLGQSINNQQNLAMSTGFNTSTVLDNCMAHRMVQTLIKRKENEISDYYFFLGSLLCSAFFLVLPFFFFLVSLLSSSLLLSTLIFTTELIQLCLDRESKRTLLSIILSLPGSHPTHLITSSWQNVLKFSAPHLTDSMLCSFLSPPSTALDLGKAYNLPTTFMLKIPGNTRDCRDCSD